jgi:shikimate dehydrogenase
MGAGGGARAVIYGLMHRGAREIRLCNRTQARAETLAREFGGPITVVPWAERHNCLDGCAMLANATSQGMIGQLPLDLELGKLPKSALVADIIYIPRETPLIEAARERAHRTVTGLGMLLHQGIPAWKAWFGIEPKVTAELRAKIEATL